MITTETMKAAHTGRPSFCTRMAKTKADAKAWAPKAKLKTPVAW